MNRRETISVTRAEAKWLWTERLRALTDLSLQFPPAERPPGARVWLQGCFLRVLGRNADESLSARIEVRLKGRRHCYVRQLRSHPSLAKAQSKGVLLRLAS